MRLKQIHIKGQYKNLKDFKMDFDGQSFIDVFVGKNGTGKSNLFEALLEIFRHLYESNKKEKYDISFDYVISYEIDSKIIEIEWSEGKFTINGEKNRITLGMTPVPDNVLIYYSGHNTKITDFVEKYENGFRKLIRKSNIDDINRFIGVDKQYKDMLLSVLLMQDDSSKAKKYIKNKWNIKFGDEEVRISLQRPFYADSKHEIDLGDPSTFYWGVEGPVRSFLDRLITCASNSQSGRIDGYQADENMYVYYLDPVKVRKEFKELTLKQLFQQFENLKIIEMLEGLSIVFNAKDINSYISTNYFSDGQFQLVYIYAIIEIFKTQNCLILLDEPDCFLHPEWQNEFLKQVFDITDTKQNNHILMTSHSAITLIEHKDKKINYFDIKKSSANCYSLPKSVAIRNLSANLIQYSEQDQLLSIINTIQIEKKPVVFTEGSTDPLILKEAWYKLYDDEIPFIPFYAFRCTFLAELLKDEKIQNEMKGFPIFGLFDFDEAYNQWNGIKGEVIEEDCVKGKIKQLTGRSVYAMMLPVSEHKDLIPQIFEDYATKKTFDGRSKCQIEHLFYEPAKKHFKSVRAPGGTEIIFNGKKIKFAKEVVPKIHKKYFKVFAPMFEFIKSKC